MKHESAGYFESGLGLTKQLTEAGLTVIKPAAFESGTFNEVKATEMRRFGVRVVFVLAWEEDILAIALAIQEAGWAWVQIEKVGPGPQAMRGWLTIVPFLLSIPEEFAKQVSVYSKSHFNLTVSPDSVDLAFSAALYDAIMLYAHATTKMISKGGNLHDGEAVTAAVRSTTFTGVTGTVVALDSNGDRMDSYEVMNYVLEEGDVMRSVAVGIFDITEGQYEAYERAIVWPGNSTSVPRDNVPGDDPCCVLSQFVLVSDMSTVMACSNPAVRIGQRRAVL